MLFGQKSQFNNLAASWSTVVYIRGRNVDPVPEDMLTTAWRQTWKKGHNKQDYCKEKQHFPPHFSLCLESISHSHSRHSTWNVSYFQVCIYCDWPFSHVLSYDRTWCCTVGRWNLKIYGWAHVSVFLIAHICIFSRRKVLHVSAESTFCDEQVQEFPPFCPGAGDFTSNLNKRLSHPLIRDDQGLVPGPQ